MCYYERTDFICGDWRWGNMKQRCPRQNRIGETCGARLPDTDNLTRSKEPCRICSDKAVKLRKLEKNRTDLERWTKEPKVFRATIEKAIEDRDKLRISIRELEQQRMSVRFSRAPNWQAPHGP
jgi:hypothetical protein